MLVKVNLIPKKSAAKGETQLISKVSFLNSRVKRTQEESFIFYALITASTELSSFIDYDEIDLIKQIAEGGFGKVYKGMWRNSVVAVKVMKLPVPLQENEALMRELAIMRFFKKHHICWIPNFVF